jgi:hypothetical protein
LKNPKEFTENQEYEQTWTPLLFLNNKQSLKIKIKLQAK